MSQRGKWFVMCRSQDARPVSDLGVKLPTGTSARVDGEVLVITATEDGDHADLEVTLHTEPVVSSEAAELAAELGVPPIGGLDARYEIAWELDRSDVVFNAYYTLAYRLAAACHGVVIDRVENKIVEA